VFAICNAEDAEVEAAKDPATYYGHHEAEFGMSWCAGFTRASALPALCLHCHILSHIVTSTDSTGRQPFRVQTFSAGTSRSATFHFLPLQRIVVHDQMCTCSFRVQELPDF
jgi:hypothetical protein